MYADKWTCILPQICQIPGWGVVRSQHLKEQGHSHKIQTIQKHKHPQPTISLSLSKQNFFCWRNPHLFSCKMLMGEAKNDQEYAMINEGNRWLRRYSCVWLLLNLPRPIHKTNQAEEEREREREITTSHVHPKQGFQNIFASLIWFLWRGYCATVSTCKTINTLKEEP